MSWNPIRRESIQATQELLRSQSDDLFSWMEPSTVGIFGEEKDINTTQSSVSFSPASTISSGPSSASSSPCPASKLTAFDEDESSESDNSEYDPFGHDNEVYSVINGQAYPASSLPQQQPNFNYGYPLLAPQDALSPITEVRHLPQLPASRNATPFLSLPPNFASRSPSPATVYPSLPLAPQPIAPQTPLQRPHQYKYKSHDSKNKRSKLARTEDSDRDADWESDGNETDDEYLPSPRLSNNRKRARALSPDFNNWSFPKSQNASSSPSSSSYSNGRLSTHIRRPAKRIRSSPPSRNSQVPSFSQPADAIEASFTCPECGWIQHNKRLPDFKRHLRTHTRPSDEDQSQGWWCKGVLASSLSEFKGEAYQFAGQLRVGGCLKTFSRRDALKRHLDNPNVACLGCIDD